MNINIHNTKAIAMTPVLPVNDKFYRIIVVTTDKGQRVEFTLFGNTRDELEVTI